MLLVPLAMSLARPVLLREVNSAQPGAPVVPDPEPRRPRRRRARVALAAALNRVAEAVAPAPVRNLSHPAH